MARDDRQPWVCGHCAVGACQRCPREITNGVKAAEPVVRCACQRPRHNLTDEERREMADFVAATRATTDPDVMWDLIHGASQGRLL